MVTKNNTAIIIPFHKNVEMLRLSLYTLKASIEGKMPQIIIVANNNNINELELAEDEFAEYEVYKIPKNLFWPGAINYGAKHTDKEFTRCS